MLPLAISNGDFGGAVDAAGAQRPLIGENDAREELELFDHTGQPLSAKPKMEPVVQRCQKSLQTLLKEGDTEYKKLTFYPDALAGVSVEPRVPWWRAAAARRRRAAGAFADLFQPTARLPSGYSACGHARSRPLAAVGTW